MQIQRLHGITPALVTPLNADETVDENAMRLLLSRMVEAGVDGVLVLGTAGEFAALSDGVKRRAVEIAVNEIDGRLPVIVGTGEPGTKRAVAMTQMAAALGADAALVVPPFYFRMAEDAVLTHYRTLAAEGGLPIILYNIPSCTKVALEPGIVCELAQDEAIIGIKDSSGDFGRFQRFVQDAQSHKFGVVTGSDTMLFASLAVGGDGSIGPTANLVPDWFVALLRAARDGRWSDALALQQRIGALAKELFAQGTFPAPVKAALSLQGIGANVVTSPIRPLDDQQTARVRVTLDKFGLL